MFSTLRQGFGDGDRLVSVEIVPPFAKDRMSMRTACERCRIQKSKCVSGENGCMLCVAKNRKCEYAVVSRPRRHASSVSSGGSKSRDDDNTVVNQHKQSNQAGTLKRRSRLQTTRQSSPLSTSSSVPEDQVRVAPVSQASLQDISITIPGPDTGVEDAQQLFFSGTLFPDSPWEVPAGFPELDPAAGDFFGSVTGPMAMAATKLEACHGGGATTETSFARGERGKHDDIKSVHTSPSANSLFEFAADQMDFLMDDSRIPATIAPNAHDNEVTIEAQPTTHLLPPPELDVSSISTSSPSSCSCMMTAVSIYEALQVQLVWGDPVAGLSPAPSPNSASADSPYSPLSSWSGSGSGSGSATCHTTALMTQQTILQRQKTMLARFESLLGCGPCWSRPDFVMLMITMCDRILTSLEAVERFVCSRTDDTNSLRVSSNNTTAAATSADVSTMVTSRAELDLQPLTRSPMVQQPRVGAWQIDDDDELELVISLIKSRVTRLGNLIAMAERTVSANGWLSHERLAQALRRRSNKLLISLSFRGFP